MDVEETIAAIASPTSPAIRGIVRMSGSDVDAVLKRVGIDDASDGRRPRRFGSRVHLPPPLGEIELEVMYWPTTRSYTGQPSAELHTHGALPILQSLVDSLVRAGARAARPGEFTLRAFLAGRLDLTQAEAVLGVIEAGDRDSLDVALRQLAGNLSQPLQQIRSELLDLLADLEAGLDFVDEDIEFISDHDLIKRMSQIRDKVQQISARLETRGGGRSRTVIAFRGRPNAGKSRLLNALTETDAAIVSEHAGTTRDVVRVEATLAGHPVEMIDTAGIETSPCEISRLSQQQADRAAREADLRLWCVDASQADLASACQEVVDQRADRVGHVIDLCVATKSDLAEATPSLTSLSNPWITTSSETRQGLDRLLAAIDDAISSQDRSETSSVPGTAARCRQSLHQTVASVTSAIEMAQSAGGHEFVAADLRSAIEGLGEVTGAVYTDDILDRVFGRFCIGK